MKPVIGLVPLVDENKDSLWMLPGYMDGITEAGGIPVMLPLTGDEETIRQLLDTVHGVLFTGGHDVHPSVYGEEPIPECAAASRERDEMEGTLLKYALEKDMPVLGICRGIQFINAYLGGTLYQDLPTQYSSEVEHHQKPPYDTPAHKVNIVENSGLYGLLNKGSLSVNSYHHQAIKEKAESLKTMAVSEDGLTEAVEMPGKRFVWAFQWHPEFSFRTDENNRKIFEKFIEISRTYAG
ncbi:MAG: gamma-glutamyl-gamma-aminobutyrate hydrolase family protein [Lachnospiraceae bacterium]|nr:gamma-glutamyl-gamma-aminobutyrate hydrolase family protein [Lachnospiraceae bacterium]